jgi:hypothetical protein
VEYWRSASGNVERLFVARGEYLYALNVKDGTLYRDFGNHGRVNLHWDAPLPGRFNGDGIPLKSPKEGVMKKTHRYRHMALMVVGAIVALMSSEQARAVNNLNFFGTAAEIDDPTGLAPSAGGKVIFLSTLALGTFGGVSSEIKDKIDSLDGKLQFDFFLLGMDCVGGSPRVQLAIDTDGDGVSNGNAFGYVGATSVPFAYICAQKNWTFEDLTDTDRHWDLSQLGGGMTEPWASAKAFINTNFPGHTVLGATLVADAFSLAMQGYSFYDNVILGGGTSD